MFTGIWLQTRYCFDVTPLGQGKDMKLRDVIVVKDNDFHLK